MRALARAGIGAGSATADLSEFLLADRRASAGKLEKGSEVKVREVLTGRLESEIGAHRAIQESAFPAGSGGGGGVNETQVGSSARTDLVDSARVRLDEFVCPRVQLDRGGLGFDRHV